MSPRTDFDERTLTRIQRELCQLAARDGFHSAMTGEQSPRLHSGLSTGSTVAELELAAEYLKLGFEAGRAAASASERLAALAWDRSGGRRR